MQVPLIAIVEDDESVRQAVDGLVRSLGYAAAAFASAEEFLTSGRLHDTSCLITDLQLPGSSGIQLQARLRADGRRTPVIFITAFPDESTRRRALAAGAVGFLTKPFDEESLIALLDRAIESVAARGAEHGT